MTIVGFIYGGILRHFGLLACFLSHNLVDSFFGLEPLLTSTINTLRISGWLAVLPFVLMIVLPVYLFFRHKSFLPDDQLVNANFIEAKSANIIEEVKATTGPYLYKPLHTGVRISLVFVILVAAAIEFGFNCPSVGNSANLTFSRDQAIKKAQEVLSANGLRPDNYSEAAWLEKALDVDEFQYIHEKDPQRSAQLEKLPETPLRWNVRFFKPLSADEYAGCFRLKWQVD